MMLLEEVPYRLAGVEIAIRISNDKRRQILHSARPDVTTIIDLVHIHVATRIAITINSTTGCASVAFVGIGNLFRSLTLAGNSVVLQPEINRFRRRDTLSAAAHVL